MAGGATEKQIYKNNERKKGKQNNKSCEWLGFGSIILNLILFGVLELILKSKYLFV
jgi:hypothetical protein